VTGVIVGTIAIVIVTVAIGLLINRKVPLLPGPKDFETDADRERKRLVSHGAGEAPATALRIREPQIAKLRTSQRCSTCRGPLEAEADDRVRYNDRELLVLHFHCPACNTRRSLYIEPDVRGIP
jgi:hypothetical protein